MGIRILGIDPGQKNTGVGVVDFELRSEPIFIHSETISDLSTTRTYDRLWGLAVKYQPDHIALLVFETSLRTIKGRPILMKSSSLTQRTIGACEVFAHLAGIPCEHYDEIELKEALAGRKNAAKKEVERYVKLAMGWTKPSLKPKGVSNHEYDAIGVCLLHQAIYGITKRFKG